MGPVFSRLLLQHGRGLGQGGAGFANAQRGVIGQIGQAGRQLAGLRGGGAAAQLRLIHQVEHLVGRCFGHLGHMRQARAGIGQLVGQLVKGHIPAQVHQRAAQQAHPLVELIQGVLTC